MVAYYYCYYYCWSECYTPLPADEVISSYCQYFSTPVPGKKCFGYTFRFWRQEAESPLCCSVKAHSTDCHHLPPACARGACTCEVAQYPPLPPPHAYIKHKVMHRDPDLLNYRYLNVCKYVDICQ